MRPFTGLSAAPHLTELFELLLAFYTADRLTRRQNGSWSRSFRLRFPVTDISAWRACRNELESLIFESTGDEVELVLSQRKREMHVDGRAAHFVLEERRPTTVALLSDGLDSLCGAFQQLQETSGNRVAFVSLVTNSRKNSRIRTVRRKLQARFPDVACFHNASLWLSKPPEAQEITQRSRTMLAIAAGLTVAAGYGSPSVVVSENGLGILNPPVPTLQARHHSSQVLHPANRIRWHRIAEQLFGVGELHYPNRFRTKAQMCAALPPEAYELIRSTSSCDRPDRHDANSDCRRCGSCVVRRRALALAGLSVHDVRYSRRHPKPEQLDPARIQEYHAGVIARDLAADDPWHALLRSHRTLRTALDDVPVADRPHARLSMLALLQQHVDEVIASSGMNHAA